MESRIFATANELGIPKNIARAILIKNVWNKKLSIEAFKRNKDYIEYHFGFTLNEVDERNLKFIEAKKVTCPVCYEEVPVSDTILIEDCGHHACKECMQF